MNYALQPTIFETGERSPKELLVTSLDRQLAPEILFEAVSLAGGGKILAQELGWKEHVVRNRLAAGAFTSPEQHRILERYVAKKRAEQCR